MSEAPTILDNSPVSTSPDLSDVQVAEMRAEWVKYGLDPAAFDRAASGEALAEPDELPAVQVLTNLKTPSLSETQAVEMADELLRAGVPREQVEAALRADGYTLAPDTRTEDQMEFDRAFGGGKPEDYKIDFAGRILPDMDATTLAGANAEFQAWLSATGFPPEIGPAVVELAMDVGQRCARMSEPERELFKREQDYTFVQMAGSEERAEELLKFVTTALDRGGPAMREALAKSGALDDAGVVMHLAHQGERLAVRRG